MKRKKKGFNKLKNQPATRIPSGRNASPDLNTPSMRAKLVDIRENRGTSSWLKVKVVASTVFGALLTLVVIAVGAKLLIPGAFPGKHQSAALHKRSAFTLKHELASTPANTEAKAVANHDMRALQDEDKTIPLPAERPIVAPPASTETTLQKEQPAAPSAVAENASHDNKSVRLEQVHVERHANSITVNLKMTNLGSESIEGRIYGVITKKVPSGDVSYFGLPETLKVDERGKVIAADTGIPFKISRWVNKTLKITSPDLIKNASSLKIIARSKDGVETSRSISL